MLETKLRNKTGKIMVVYIDIFTYNFQWEELTSRIRDWKS
jgi:hypothetical protein